MPFKSKAQRAKFASLVKEGKMSQATFDKWQAETPSHKPLPNKVTKNGSGKIQKVKRIKEI